MKLKIFVVPSAIALSALVSLTGCSGQQNLAGSCELVTEQFASVPGETSLALAKIGQDAPAAAEELSALAAKTSDLAGPVKSDEVGTVVAETARSLEALAKLADRSVDGISAEDTWLLADTMRGLESQNSMFVELCH